MVLTSVTIDSNLGSCRHSIVRMAIRLRAVWGSNPERGRKFFLQNVRTHSVVHPASYLIGTGVISRGLSGESVRLTINLRLVPRLRMSGAIPLLHL